MFDDLFAAAKRNAVVSVSHFRKDGEPRVRVGTIEKLTATHVTIKDFQKGYRTVLLSLVQGVFIA